MSTADDRIDNHALADTFDVYAFTDAVDVAEKLMADYPWIFRKRIVTVINMNI
ncbi:hypothetical protein SRABI106_03614 [Rahnella aquatilis]|nr:hypothetical protein SRABI106_03614 [Rahnella aquatilis]